MKTALCLLLILSVRLSAAAPESLAGKVYRDYHLFSGITNAGEMTIIFNSDGSYVYLKSAIGVKETPDSSAVTGLPAAHWGAIVGPPADGRYQYQKTGDTTGALTLVSDGGASTGPTTLYFGTATTGSTSTSGLAGLGGEAFYLTDLLPGGSSAAVANVSSRGRVSDGHPLIVGFVIPGSTEREVLVRVIGPSLASFGVTGAWASSSLQIYKNSNAIFGDSFRFPYWSDVPPAGTFLGTAGTISPEAGLRKIFNYVGAFPLVTGSMDSAVVIRLAPGAYTVVASTASGDAGGEALIEAYPLP